MLMMKSTWIGYEARMAGLSSVECRSYHLWLLAVVIIPERP